MLDISSINFNKAAIACKIADNTPGLRPFCVPFGAVFRVPGHLASKIGVKPGTGADWMFLGRGRIIGQCMGSEIEEQEDGLERLPKPTDNDRIVGGASTFYYGNLNFVGGMKLAETSLHDPYAFSDDEKEARAGPSKKPLAAGARVGRRGVEQGPGWV